MKEEKTAFERYRDDKVLVAKQLFYGKDVIKAIKKAKTENEITMILRTRRLREDLR